MSNESGLETASQTQQYPRERRAAQLVLALAVVGAVSSLGGLWRLVR